MAYTAPKWTQMTAPSGATSVNAITAAGDLFNKAMDSANKGLKNYDTGVEARRQDDSDVNTAALRRQLEGAGSLDELNAMQGNISAEGLQGYGKRIDADALSQSFNKERGVMRGDFQNQFNERMSTEFANATNPDEVRKVSEKIAAANEQNPWLDISSQIDQGSSGLKTALAKEAQTATDLQVQQQAGMDVAGLVAARDALVPGSLNFGENQKRLTSQIETTKAKDQALFDQGAVSTMRVASGNGLKALEDERDRLLEAAKSNPNISEANVLSTFDQRRPFALQNALDKVSSGARARRQTELDTNLEILNTAKDSMPDRYKDLISIDDLGNLSFDPSMDDASKERFAQIVTRGFGYAGEGDSFVERNAQFFDPETSTLGADFGSLSEQELNLANDLRKATNAKGLELSDAATSNLANATVNIQSTHNDAVRRAEEDYKAVEAVYASDPAALKAAQAKNRDPYQHMMDMGLNEYETSFSNDEASGSNLRELIADTLEAGFTNSEIILAMDASTLGEGWLEDNQVDVEEFKDFLAVQVNEGLRQRANKVDQMIEARDKRDAQIASFDLIRRNNLSTAKSEAMTLSGKRNTAKNVNILNKALGIK
tara:strand:- start:730 stop:2535 length:1806 start_codon:yes stop_codon:yes gene_type:complete